MNAATGRGTPPVVDARAGSRGARIDLDDVCRWFGGDSVVKAIDQVNLHVDETAAVVVLGPSGSGKTTPLNLIGADVTGRARRWMPCMFPQDGTCQRPAAAHRPLAGFPRSCSTVVRSGLTTVESVLIGRVAGVAAGYGLLAWLTATTVSDVMPEIGVTAALPAGAVAAAVLLGIGTVQGRRTGVPTEYL